MNYLTLGYYVLVAAVFAVYYLLPKQKRWIALLAGSFAFLYLADRNGIPSLCWMCVSSFLLAPYTSKSRGILFGAIILSVLPFWIHIGAQVISLSLPGWILPLGLSYISLEIISYLADCASGIIEPDRNLFRYALYVFFFPQVVQGPIPRHSDLSAQLNEGHDFDEENVIRGFLRILCGLYLKFLISDRAGIAANTFYAEAGVYTGPASWIGISMYMVQLYTDFFACVLLSQGVARMFGIRLKDNFDHPFTSQSTAEIWTRWHITLGAWLRQYVYYPLGGSKKGKIRKYINLLAVFVASAIWHGVSLTYIAWGVLTAFYQIAGSLTLKKRDALYAAAGISGGLKKRMRQCVTVFLFVLSSVLFRSYGFRTLLANLASAVRFGPLPEETGFLGLSVLEWVLLSIAFVIFFVIQHFNQTKDLETAFIQRPWGQRYAFYLVLILAVLIFGTYGFGYDAQAFIYGGF